jgi:hypothetical protein
MLRNSVSALIAAACLIGAPIVAQADAPVGVAGAVNPRTESTPPGQQTRTVMVGAQMLMNERVVTGPQGSTQLVFNDHSTLTIGPSSEVVIDQFVYNPTDGSGRMAVSLGKGVMRFVGGELSHKGNATITTPSATVGIRGGIVMMRVRGPETAVINLFGNSNVTATRCTAGACTVSILRPGFGTTVSDASSPPAAPFLVPSDQIVTLTVQLQSSPTQNGGSNNPPNDSNTQANGTGQSNSGLVAHNTSPQSPQGGGSTPPDTTNKDLDAGAGSFANTTTVGDITRQQQLASNSGTEPTNFPDGTTSIGDLRTVTAPRVFNYSQSNVPIFYFGDGPAQQVGSYNFNLTINLGAAANRSLNANATNINISGAAWPYAAVSNVNMNFSLPAPDFQFGGGPVTSGAIGFGTSFTCASGVDCSFGFSMRNSGGRVAAFADHSVVAYQTPPPCSGEGCPGSPPVGTFDTAGGSGTAARDLGGPVTTLSLVGGKRIGKR